ALDESQEFRTAPGGTRDSRHLGTLPQPVSDGCGARLSKDTNPSSLGAQRLTLRLCSARTAHNSGPGTSANVNSSTVAVAVCEAAFTDNTLGKCSRCSSRPLARPTNSN